jgi:hypothetical protein
VVGDSALGNDTKAIPKTAVLGPKLNWEQGGLGEIVLEEAQQGQQG